MVSQVVMIILKYIIKEYLLATATFFIGAGLGFIFCFILLSLPI